MPCPAASTTRCLRRFQKSRKSSWTMPFVPDTFSSSREWLSRRATSRTDKPSTRTMRRMSSNCSKMSTLRFLRSVAVGEAGKLPTTLDPAASSQPPLATPPSHSGGLLFGCHPGPLSDCHLHTSSFSQNIEGFNSFLAEFFNVSLDTFGSHTKRFDDLDLFAWSLTSELGSKHSKRGVVALVMKKDRLDATKYLQRPSLQTTLIRSFRGVAPSGTRGNSACGKVSSPLERCVLN